MFVMSSPTRFCFGALQSKQNVFVMCGNASNVMAAMENKLKLSDVADDARTEEENDEEKGQEEEIRERGRTKGKQL